MSAIIRGEARAVPIRQNGWMGRTRSGLFVVLEGIDGSGKSTQARRIADWLVARGERVVLTREPTDGEWGRRYRRWARGELDAKPDEVLDYFVRDRHEHVRERIAPALAGGAVVVCDRYVASTRAYQSADGIDRERLAARLDAERFPEPDLVLWLRLPVATALARLGADATERYEDSGFLERVDAEYARLCLLEIDAALPPDQVEADLRARIEPLL
jgi:dTMP kinase